jgi:hypothetical protein
VHGDDDGASELVGLDAIERSGEEVDLAAVESLVGSALVGDDAGVFEDVGVKAEDAGEGGLEGEVDAGLDHRGAKEAARVWRLRDGGGAKVTHEGSERGLGIGGVDDAVVIAWDGEDGSGIETVGLVELVVVVEGFAEVVDEVAEVEEEGWDVGGIGFSEVGDHLVGDEGLG